MSTTDLLVEYLILGSLANVWLAFAINYVFSPTIKTITDIADLVDKTSVIAVIIFVAITYTLGGLINFVANSLGNRYQQGYRNKIFLDKAGINYKGSKTTSGAREVLSRVSPEIAQRFRSDGHIIRVSRGNTLNFFCLGLVLLLYIPLSPIPVIIGTGLSFLLALLSFFWWRKTFKSNYEQMVDAYKDLVKRSQNDTSESETKESRIKVVKTPKR